MAKIISLEKLSKIVDELKKKKKKVSLCHGTFDLLHIGHIDHFEASKNISDFLIVSVTGDKFVLKGPNRPRFKLSERVRFLSKINSIDYVIESHNETAIEIIKTLIKRIKYLNFYLIKFRVRQVGINFLAVNLDFSKNPL